MDLADAIEVLKKSMEEHEIVAANGIGEELFLFLSTLVPIVNVDLLLLDDKNGILLSWRDDVHCGRGWHIPGGCIRFHETIDQCIHRTAQKELGTDVFSEMKFKGVFQGIRNSAKPQSCQERTHFVSLLYECRIKDLNQLQNLDGKEEVGHLSWFNNIPSDFIEIQSYYKEIVRAKLLKIECE